MNKLIFVWMLVGNLIQPCIGVITETFILTDPNGKRGDEFGYAIAACDQLIVVGAYGDSEDNSTSYDQGSIFIYKRNGTQTSLFGTKAKPPTPKRHLFGYSVACNNKFVVVGAPGQNTVFIYSTTEPYQLVHTITRSNISSFGKTLQIDDENGIFIASSSYNEGIVIIYRYVNDNWSVTQEFLPSQAMGLFGLGIAVTTTHMAISSPYT